MTTTASLTEQIAVIDMSVVLDHLTDQLREAREMRAAACDYAHLLALLVDARAALGPQHHDLATRIDDALRPELRRYLPEPIHADGDCGLVLESYGNGHAWLRPA